MRQHMIMLMLAGVTTISFFVAQASDEPPVALIRPVTSAMPEESASSDMPPAEPALPIRLANGVIVDGEFQGTNVEGLVLHNAKGVVVTYPWKYLSLGTRYRYEHPFLSKAVAVQPVKPAEASAPAAKKAPAPVVLQPIKNASQLLENNKLQMKGRSK